MSYNSDKSELNFSLYKFKQNNKYAEVVLALIDDNKIYGTFRVYGDGTELTGHNVSGKEAKDVIITACRIWTTGTI